MKQIFNWTIGSFFRTIGRTIALLVLGSLLYYIISSNDIRLTDLFVMKVNASSFTSLWVPTYSDSNRTTLSTSKTLTSNTDNNFTSTKFYFTRGYYLHNYGGKNYTGGQLVIPFNLTTPILGTNTSSTITQQSYCDKWTWESIDSYNNVIKWKCSSYNFGVDPSTINDREYVYPTTSIKANLHTFLNGVAYEVLCQVKDNAFYCPISYGQDELDYIEIFTNVNYGSSSLTKQYDISIDYFANIEYDGTVDAINSQTQQQHSDSQAQQQQSQQQHEEMMNSTTTDAEDEAADFFSDFDVPDVGGLSAIITAPLNTIQSLLSNSCSNLVLPLPFVNENLTLPCLGSIYNQHFGAFFTLYQTIILAIVSYRCIRSIYFDIHGFTNPNDDRIEVMDL